MSDRIAAAFATNKQAALISYLVGGFPDLAASERVGLACADGGADLVEIGVPFSDPLADGPTIHAAASRALAGGTTVAGVLSVCETVSARAPVCLMVYAGCVLARGAASFVRLAAEAGASGLIVPDLPWEEAGEVRAACRDSGLSLVPLVAPTTPHERLAQITAGASGFVYAVSTTGTTGERGELAEGAERTVSGIRAVCELPVAVGFGVSTPEQARSVSAFADGVIVGSRIVRAAEEGGPHEVERVVAALAAGLGQPANAPSGRAEV